MNKTELKKKTLTELDESLGHGDAVLQSVGGGDRSYGNPYQEAEYNALVTAGYFTGGYVELDGSFHQQYWPCGLPLLHQRLVREPVREQLPAFRGQESFEGERDRKYVVKNREGSGLDKYFC